MTDATRDAEISAYIPTTDEVREQYSTDDDGNEYWSTVMALAEFDRWLLRVQAEAWAEGYGAGREYQPKGILSNPYAA